MSIKVVPALSDNFIYLIELKNGTICIDPGDAKPVLEALQTDLIAILNTHHHADHTDGNQELKNRFNCPLIAPDDERIQDVDQFAKEGIPVIIDELIFDVLFVPGHTKSHIAYYSEKLKAVFTGDSLFTCGCGRIFEGTPEEMFNSLQKIAKLPADTLVYGGHDYTKKNIEFALSLEPENKELKRCGDAPWSIDQEKKRNPFLRTSDPSILNALDMEKSKTVEVFAVLRQLKNDFL